MKKLSPDDLRADAHKALYEHFITRSYYFSGAWFFSFPLRWGDSAEPIERSGEPIKFSKWFEHESPKKSSKPIGEMRESLIKKYIDHAKWLQEASPVHEEPMKNMAFGYLYNEIIGGDIFSMNTDDNLDYRQFQYISILYLCLAILYENFDEAVVFIREIAPSQLNPYSYLHLVSEKLSIFGNQLIGYWYANSQEVRGFVKKWQEQRDYLSEAGALRATPPETIAYWKNEAEGLRGKGLSKRAVANIIAKKGGWNAETIRKKI